MNLNLERFGRLFYNGVEQTSIDIGDGHFDKAVDTPTAKASAVQLKPTRVTGGDDVTYPVFSPQVVLPSLRAHGADPVKHKAPKLWGGYVPAQASDTTLYPMVDANGAKFVKNIGFDGTGTDFGYYNEESGEFVKAQGASGTVIQPITSISGVTPSTDEITVRVGTSGCLLNTATWTLTSASGTLGSDIPYAQMCADIIKVNTGDLYYENSSIHTDGSHKLRIEDEDGNVIERDIPMLLSADSFVDTQLDSNNKSEAWAVKVLDGTEHWLKNANVYPFVSDLLPTKYEPGATIICTHYAGKQAASGSTDYGDGTCWVQNTYNYPRFYIRDDRFTTRAVAGTGIQDFEAYLASEYAKGTPVIVLYPLATPAVSTHAIDKVELTEKALYTVTSEAELPVTEQATYLGVGE